MSEQVFNAAEKHQSQIPAIQILVALGFKPISQTDAIAMREAGSAMWFWTMCLSNNCSRLSTPE